MPRLAMAVAALALLLTGGLLAWPHVRGWLFLQRTPARILDVLSLPLADGTVRLEVAYEYALPQKPGTKEHVWQLGWQLGDAFFRPVSDPVIEAVRSEQVVRTLLGVDQTNPETDKVRREALMRALLEPATWGTIDTPERRKTARHALLDFDPKVRWRTAFFAANDPVGTAFILDESAASASHRLQIGAVLGGLGVVLGFYALRRGRDS